jgi:ATP synthase F1 delta subunit
MREPLNTDAKNFVAGIVGYIRKGRAGSSAVPKITKLLKRVTVRARTEGVAHVESAVALTPEEKSSLAKALERVLGHTVTLECKVAPDLVGGFRVSVGDWIVDTSWDEQLHNIARLVV